MLPRRVWCSRGYFTRVYSGGSRPENAIVKEGRDIMLENKLQHGGDESVQRQVVDCLAVLAETRSKYMSRFIPHLIMGKYLDYCRPDSHT